MAEQQAGKDRESLQRQGSSPNNRLWLTWETQRRNFELAQAFGCDFGHFDFSGQNSLLRYLRSAQSTLSKLFSSKYETVFAQCPSIVLALLVVLVRPFRSFVLVIDAHNCAIEYTYSTNLLLRWLTRFVFRHADYVIVSNQFLSPRVKEIGAVPLILPDKLPLIEEQELPTRFASLSRPLITLIATFAADEPIEVFLQGIEQTEQAFTLLVTGRKSKAGSLTRFESEKVCFTDFLSAEDFEALIQHSDLVVDLTTRENCLVCGAYEAVAVKVPAILSDSKALRLTFPKGCLFAGNSAQAYWQAVESYFADPALYRKEIEELRSEFEEDWNKYFTEVNSAVRYRISLTD